MEAAGEEEVDEGVTEVAAAVGAESMVQVGVEVVSVTSVTSTDTSLESARNRSVATVATKPDTLPGIVPVKRLEIEEVPHHTQEAIEVAKRAIAVARQDTSVGTARRKTADEEEVVVVVAAALGRNTTDDRTSRSSYVPSTTHFIPSHKMFTLTDCIFED
jgi:predicted Zn-dependent protease